MPFEPQRFIHASNVRLDVPVSVHMSEQLTDELRHALEDATLTAFDFVIDTCIAKSIDYLLLSGNVFLEADRSLRARLTLLNGFRRLHAKQIPVFVLPGDADPPEAWRTIPEMPDNVTVCFSSNPEPDYLERNGRIITTVSASMWYGETDSLGIRVIGRGDDGVDPFRIGIVSRAKYDESRRMAALTASTDDDFLNLGGEEEHEDDAEDNPLSLQGVPIAGETTAEYEAGFRNYIDNLMREGRLNYVAYMGELDRLTITLESGKVHCSGTTQPRNQLEADCGLCSLVHVDTAGKISIDALNTSAVDWKNIDLRVESDATLNRSLEQMKQLLMLQARSHSDRVWAIRWTVRGPLPVLQNFIEDDLELAVAVELEELESEGRHIRLVHEIRTLPDPWEVPDKASLGQQYADLITEDAIVSRRKLMNYVRREKHLSEGWRQRFEALVAGVDRERILSRMRVDGANWFVADAQELLPDLDDFDEDILKDEEVPEFGLSDDEGGSEMLLNADVETTETDTEMLDEYETDVQDTDEDEYAAYDDGAEKYEDADEYEEEDNE
jgi:DNA repair exonuclease SbcCD nuclease subunit